MPLTVFAFLLLDIVSTLIGQAYGASDLGPSGLLPTTQMFLIAAAAAATMWRRPRTAVVLSVVVVALVLTVGPTGQEDWLLLVTGVAAAARASRRNVIGVALAQIGYALCFGLRAEQQDDGGGWGAGLTTLGLAAAALAAGLVARWLLATRDRRQRWVRERERERAHIRAVERHRLAGDLEAVVIQGLATIQAELDIARPPSDLDRLRQGLARIDRHSRLLLSELRTLLEVLRRDPPPETGTGSTAVSSGARRPVDLLTARHVRMAATAVFTLLAVRVAVDDVGSRTVAEVAVPVLGLLACAVVVWRPVVGAVTAAAALILAVLLNPAGSWEALPVALLGLLGSLRVPPRRVWLVVLAVAGYGAALVVTGSAGIGHAVAVGYLGFAAVAVGLAARHFAEARDGALRQLDDLAVDRERVEAEERTAVARELHDVVAYQLSVTTLLVMATSLSDDPEVLAATWTKVRRSTAAAHDELSTLLHTMRDPEVDQLQPTPLVAPGVNAQALGRRLRENGFRPVLDIDPAADDLDPTTQRTLSRIMQEASTNILRYAPAGSVCHYALTVQPGSVRLRILSPLAGAVRRSNLSLGWGLRGIRERVELTQGDFQAGPDHGQWALAVTLPARPPAPDASTTRADRAGPVAQDPVRWE